MSLRFLQLDNYIYVVIIHFFSGRIFGAVQVIIHHANSASILRELIPLWCVVTNHNTPPPHKNYHTAIPNLIAVSSFRMIHLLLNQTLEINHKQGKVGVYDFLLKFSKVAGDSSEMKIPRLNLEWQKSKKRVCYFANFYFSILK